MHKFKQQVDTLYLFNSDGRELQLFGPRQGNTVRMYCCGPTVYNYAHIGNLRAYTVQDILRRCLLALGYELLHVMNITDVGHLTDDGDDGEDKMLQSAREKGRGVREIADYYSAAFFRDCSALHIQRPEIICRATDHIAEMQQLIRQIESAGYTYYRNGNLYFDTGKWDDYGRLAGRVAETERLSRTGADAAKKSQQDFVLWFSKGKFADQAMQWDSPWGRGYPGWHIECSAMAKAFLGTEIDIHCGGVDHKTVHHPNEIAQSESIATEEQRPWVRFWLHNEFVVMAQEAEGGAAACQTAEKIAKSSGNAITIDELAKQGFAALDYRYFLFGGHYRSQLQFHHEAMVGAQKSRQRLQQKVLEVQQKCAKTPNLDQCRQTVQDLQDGKLQNPYLHDLWGALLQDLNTAQAIACLWNALRDRQLPAEQKFAVLEFGESLLALGLFEAEQAAQQSIPTEWQGLLAEREQARKNKDYTRADEIRKQLQDAGYQIVDTPEGPKLKA